MPSAVPTFQVCLGADFGKGFSEEAILQLHLGDQRGGVPGRGITCEASTWCGTEAGEGVMQIRSSTLLAGLKCWV